MKTTTMMILCVLLALAMIGSASAEVTMQTGTSGTGNVYTTGNIYIDSTPPGVTAVLDGGDEILYTPGTFNSVLPGTHSIILAYPGYQTFATQVEVTVGSTTNVIQTLERVVNPGAISVNSDPRGAFLNVDGISMGKTNQIVGNLAPGNHVVTITAAEYETWQETVTVTASEITTVNAKLISEVNPSTGDLRVTSVPSGAAVYVDNVYKGITPVDGPLDVIDLTPGSHALILTRTGYQDYKSSANLEASKTTMVNAQMQASATVPATATAEIGSTPAGAQVYINNAFVGITPLSFQNVQPGNYTIEIKLEGYQPYSTGGEVKTGQNVQLFAALAPPPTTVPTTKAPIHPFIAMLAISIAAMAGYLVSRR
jgi:hypothetical protein